MKRFIFIFLSIISISSIGYSFPDMSKHPHCEVWVDDSLTKSSRLQDALKMSKIYFDGFRGFQASCPITKHSIVINNLDDDPKCYVISPENKMECSFFCYEGQGENGWVSKFFYIKDESNFIVGRVTVVEKSGIRYAMWQTFVDPTKMAL